MAGVVLRCDQLPAERGALEELSVGDAEGVGDVTSGIQLLAAGLSMVVDGSDAREEDVCYFAAGKGLGLKSP